MKTSGVTMPDDADLKRRLRRLERMIIALVESTTPTGADFGNDYFDIRRENDWTNDQ